MIDVVAGGPDGESACPQDADRCLQEGWRLVEAGEQCCEVGPWAPGEDGYADELLSVARFGFNGVGAGRCQRIIGHVSDGRRCGRRRSSDQQQEIVGHLVRPQHPKFTSFWTRHDRPHSKSFPSPGSSAILRNLSASKYVPGRPASNARSMRASHSRFVASFSVSSPGANPPGC